MSTLLEGLLGDARQQEVARRLASLPMRMGRLGLRSALRTAPAAYWASWADALPMIEGRLPQVAQLVTAQLEEVHEAVGCFWGDPTGHKSLGFGRVRQPTKLDSFAFRLSTAS